MDWVVTLVVGVLAFLGGTGLDRFSAAGRLRSRLKAGVEVYAGLPEDSPVRADLLLHIERQALLMIAEEDPLTTREIRDRKWGRLYVYLVFPVFASQVFFASMLWLQVLCGVVALSAFLYGQIRITRVERAANLRKLAKQSLADVDNAKYVIPTGRQLLAGALESVLPPSWGSGAEPPGAVSDGAAPVSSEEPRGARSPDGCTGSTGSDNDPFDSSSKR